MITFPYMMRKILHSCSKAPTSISCLIIFALKLSANFRVVEPFHSGFPPHPFYASRHLVVDFRCRCSVARNDLVKSWSPHRQAQTTTTTTTTTTTWPYVHTYICIYMCIYIYRYTLYTLYILYIYTYIHMCVYIYVELSWFHPEIIPGSMHRPEISLGHASQHVL